MAVNIQSTDNIEGERMSLPSAFWYEIWSQVIVCTWSAFGEVEEAKKELVGMAGVVQWLQTERGRAELRDLTAKKAISDEAAALLLGLPEAWGEPGRKSISWRFLCDLKIVAGAQPLNFPNLSAELVDVSRGDAPKYMAKNAYRNINGWAQDLVELGGSATIKVPAPPPVRERTKRLDWYIKQGFHMPFAPNNRGPFTPGNRGINVSSALGFSGARVGDESASAALDCDAEWFGVFPQIMASAWHQADHRERLLQRTAKEALADARASKDVGKERAVRESMTRARDALFAEFGYNRPVGLEVDFVLVEAAYDDKWGWTDDSLIPDLIVRIPPPPSDVFLHPIALADYRATGKAQLFTT
jgi:hypothetical protein